MRFCYLRYPELAIQERTSVYHLRKNATGIYREEVGQMIICDEV